MKRFSSSILSTLAATLLLLGTQATQAGPVFRATLTGDQEVPPVATDASGIATLSLNDDLTRLEILIELAGLDLDGLQTPATGADDVVGLHIHRAPAGVNGPVVFGFINPNSDLNGDLVIDPVASTVFSAWDLAEGNGTTLAAELASLLDDGLYLNVHTPANPAGEIRGQVLRVPEPGSLALLAVALLALAWSGWRRLGAPI